MTARTVRDSGYQDTIVIFTITDKESPYATCINLSTHPDASLIQLPRSKFFHRTLCTPFGYPAYSSTLDYFIIKTLPGRFIDKSDYDFILYLDSDILVHPGQSLDEIFDSCTPIADFNSRPALQDIKQLRRHLTQAEALFAATIPGIGGGAFGIPRGHYGFFELYRECYLAYLAEIPHDQPVLSFVKIRYHRRHPFAQWPNRKYFRHYWGNRKQQMIKDYERRYGAGSARAFLTQLALRD
ncbi:MAG: hypothetical protein J0M17_18030 [Planctomycetes bacterium]|nr:hypothetical protein [Planctomycetota bacterium]